MQIGVAPSLKEKGEGPGDEAGSPRLRVQREQTIIIALGNSAPPAVAGEGIPLYVLPGPGGLLGRARSLPGVQPVRCGTPRARLRLAGRRPARVAPERRGAPALPGRRLRPTPRLALPPGRAPVRASGTHGDARPAGPARPRRPRGRGRLGEDDRGGPHPEGVRDPRPGAPGAHPHAALADVAVAGGDGDEVLPAVRGRALGRRLGASAPPDRIDGHRETGAASAGRTGPVLGPRRGRRGASP